MPTGGRSILHLYLQLIDLILFVRNSRLLRLLTKPFPFPFRNRFVDETSQEIAIKHAKGKKKC